MLEYFKRRTDFELDMKEYLDSIGMKRNEDYEFSGHMFLLLVNEGRGTIVISYDYVDDDGTDKFQVDDHYFKSGKFPIHIFKTFDELISHLSTISEIIIKLRVKKMKNLI